MNKYIIIKMSSEEEDEGPRRGKGRPRGKTGNNRGGNRGRGDRGRKKNRYNNNGRDYRGNGGGRKYYKDTEDNDKNYDRNFDRSNYDNQDYEEDEKEDNNNNYYNKNNYKNREKHSQYKNDKYYQKDNQKSNIKNNIYKEKKPLLSIQKMRELEEKDDINEVIMFFHNNDDIYEEIKRIKFKPESCYLLMKIIQKISETNSEPVLIIINKIIDNTRFLQDTVCRHLEEKVFEDEKYLNFLLDVIKFLNKCLLINTKSIKININLNEHKTVLEEIKEKESNENIKDIMNSIINEINEYEKKKVAISVKDYEQKKKMREDEFKNRRFNDKNYKEMDIIINTKDFTKDIKYNIDPNIIKGPYESYEKYINTMFFLEYEDCYRSLRRAIFNLIEEGKSLSQLNRQERWTFERKKHDIYCYCEGEIIKAEMNHEGILITIDFVPLSGKKIKFTKRMINGSLVIITNNDFKDYLLTTVSYNPYIEKKLLEKSNDQRRKNKLNSFNIPKEPRYRIKLELINISPQSFKFLIQNRINLQLFESRAYFQSYIHVLNRLQNMVIKELPFEDIIVKANVDNLLNKNERKEYIYENNIIKPNEDIFPDCLKNSLDESQLTAIKHCLTSKIALIQGPPGTGKTHVGSIITNILIQNLKKNSKILVVCFTNHALDQFLENILKDPINENRIVRIGGRCKNETIKKLVLNSEKYKCSYYREYERHLNAIGSEMAGIIKLIDKTKKIIIDEVKEDYPQIYEKVVDDFFKILNIKKQDYIPKYSLDQNTIKRYRNNLNKIRENIIGNKIFNFWCCTGQENNKISDLISNIFDEMDIDNYNQIIDASGNFKNYSNDNNKLLNKLKNFSKVTFNKNISNFKENDNIDNEYDEDESEEDEEISLGCSLDDYNERVGDNDYLKEDDLMDDINLFQSTLVNYDGELSEMQSELALNDDKINYLLDEKNNINFFQIGHTLVKLIINYVKSKRLDQKLCDEEKLKNYAKIMNEKKQLNLMIDANTIKKKQIVAMTTTGCSKYSTILEQLKFEIVIIEEAAEVLEPHVLALLTKNTKKLIMIGDHKQLKPKPYSFELSKKYNFDVSMFERLINNNIKYINLKYQRRMKPLFADFVRLIYGKSEYIDKGVDEREEIKGMNSDMFIITHKQKESEKEGMKSKCNEYEAIYLVKLCDYLLKQGYQSSQITILTFYVGQVLTILSHIKDSSLRDENIKVSSVDNYQGEENDIILLSLVRSNDDDIIGFLRAFNRVCVAFSRAKLGFYIIGNIDCIIRGIDKLKKDKNNENNSLEESMFDVWEKIKDEGQKLDIIGNILNLKCQKHGTITQIKNYNDFANCPEGGCNKKCRKIKKCGHACEKACHNYDCNEDICMKPCDKINPNCFLKKHKCKKICSNKCGPCKEIIKIKLNCGHEIECKCYEAKEQEKIQCQNTCNKILKCGHKCQLKCYEKCESKPCMELVIRKLSCNHSVEVSCSCPKYEILCNEKCNATLPCGHKCSGTCGKCLGGTLHVKCKKTCEKNLVCGHRCEQRCSAECICYKQCPNRCPHGECGELCCDICIDCVEPCAIKCQHRECQNSCGEKCSVEPCNKRCKKKMKCKHQCMGLCGERCPDVCKICDPGNECFEIFFGHEDDEDALFYKTECGHIIEYRDMDTYLKSQRTISIPTCPKCKSQLIWEPRYQEYIREQFKLVQNVKKQYIELNTGNNGEFEKKTKEILARILVQYEQNKILIFESLIGKNIKQNKNNNNLINEIIDDDSINYDKNNLKIIIPTIFKLYEYIVKKKDKNNMKLKLNSTYNLLTLAEKFMAIEYMNYEIKKKENLFNDMTRDERKFMKNFFVIKDYFTKLGLSLTYYFFNDLKLKIDNMLFYTILKLKPNISKLTNKTIDDIINSNFTTKYLDLKSLYKNYLAEKAVFIFGNLGYDWYKCSKGHFYCAENSNENKNNDEIECPLCLNKGKKKNKKININKEISTSINTNIENNPLLNQDQEVLRDMRLENLIINEHIIDPDILLMMIDHPEWSEYN